MRNLISPQHRALYQEFYRTFSKPARPHRWARRVDEIAQQVAAKTILDYGCGRGRLSKSAPHLQVVGYDPAIAGFDAEPGPADLVVCLDVLEHIEPQFLENVVAHVTSLAVKAALFVVSCRLSGEFLPNGENTHSIVRPAGEWGRFLRSFAPVEEIEPSRDLEYAALMVMDRRAR